MHHARLCDSTGRSLPNRCGHRGVHSALPENQCLRNVQPLPCRPFVHAWAWRKASPTSQQQNENAGKDVSHRCPVTCRQLFLKGVHPKAAEACRRACPGSPLAGASCCASQARSAHAAAGLTCISQPCGRSCHVSCRRCKPVDCQHAYLSTDPRTITSFKSPHLAKRDVRNLTFQHRALYHLKVKSPD